MNPISALIIANMIWGAASPIFKFALENIPPFTLAFIRFFFASMIFLPTALNKWQNLSKRRLLEIFLVGFFGIFINITFFFLGLQKTESINAPIIASSGPVFLYILSVIFLKEKPRRKVFFGMIISLLGVLVVILSPIFLDGKQIVCGQIEGNIFFMMATIGSVASTIIDKDLMKKINPYVVSFLSFFISSIMFLPFMLVELRTWNIFQINAAGLVGILFGVLFSSAMAYYLYYYAMTKIPAQEVGLFTYIDPVIAVVIAIPLLHEYPTVYFFIGTILVFLGIYIAEGRIHYHPLHLIKKFKLQITNHKKISKFKDQISKTSAKL